MSDDGYRTVALLDRRTVRRLRKDFDELGLPKTHGFHATSANSDRATARSVDLSLKAALDDALRSLTAGHRPFLAAFISKGVGQDVTVDFHQDWTYTDERHHRAILVWVPLVDVGVKNGAMRVIPGSHLWTTGIRASGTGHATDGHRSWFDERAITVELEAGNALVYDAALVHGSGPNRSRRVRPAAAIALAPADAALAHFHVDGAGHLRGARIDESHFTTRPFASEPVGEPIQPWAPLVASSDFDGHVRA